VTTVLGEPSGDLPLAGVRVLDLAVGHGDAMTRLLADLGADVLKIEPPGGSPARDARPAVAGTSIAFALHNANKRSAVLDSGDDDDRRQFLDLVGDADILVDDGIPGQAAAFGTTAAELASRFEQLVVLSVTDFGCSGPRASWRATDPVLYAMSTALSRSGPPTGAPVLPPDGIASATAAVQAAWAVLAAYYHRLRGGTGDYIDFSRFEGVVQALDPPFGAMGQAASGQSPAGTWRGRPRNQDVYPIFACRDGFVRLCVLSPRQWHAMRAWLGEPEQFRDPRYDKLGARFSAAREIGTLTAELFADKTMDELVESGQQYGIPIAAVLTPAEALSSGHFRSVGALTTVQVAPDATVDAPVGPFVIDGQRMGLRTPAQDAGGDIAGWAGPVLPATAGQTADRPFDGLRILDLGVIVAGGELGRLFADLGAEVIKVESAAYPDGLRQSRADQAMGESFAWTHRNEYGLGLDLRNPTGAALFRRLVAKSDAVFANFKPGTLTALGFPYSALRELNPGIVLAESSAFGDTGPWSNRMGYGPLVRAVTGVTRLWTGEDTDGGAPFLDAVTIFPDHVIARIVALGALASLVRRERTGAGAHVHISQAEVAINQLDTAYVAEQVRLAGLAVADDQAAHLVYPCAGEDEWCVISLRDDAHRSAAIRTAGGLDIAAWAASLDKVEVAERLQAAGVPAGPMNRSAEVLNDPQIVARKVFTDMAHPLFDAALPAEAGPAPFRHIPPAEQRPAPVPGEHTRDVCQKVHGLDAAEIDNLIDDGVLFAPPPPRK
jgi:crotonobetainyl-CoA:carnitine CoA-transferase CaiB-like acyl-CoA transferase